MAVAVVAVVSAASARGKYSGTEPGLPSNEAASSRLNSSDAVRFTRKEIGVLRSTRAASSIHLATAVEEAEVEVMVEGVPGKDGW
jgi:hypothetical protein